MKKFYLLLISFISLNFGYGQNYVQDILAGFGTTNMDGTAPSVGATNVLATGFERSPNISRAGSASVAYRTKGWTSTSLSQARSAGQYIEWSITPEVEFKTNITGLRIQLDNYQDQGPKNFKLYYSINGFASYHQLKSGNETITLVNQVFDYTGLNINAPLGGTISFRLYAWNATDTVGGELHIKRNSSWKLPSDSTEMWPGAIVIGTLSTDFDGLLYSNGAWYPHAPSLSTNNLKDVRIHSGTYTVLSQINVKNLTVAPGGAGIIVRPLGSLKVHGHLITSDNVIVESTSMRFGSLMVVNYIDDDNLSNSIPAQVTGKAKYSRHVNNLGGNDLISAPVTGQRFDLFRMNNENLAHNTDKTEFLFGPFNKTTGKYDLYTDQSIDELRPGIGYRAASKLKDPLVFEGDVNTGSINVPIIQSGPHAKEWNLIGNPYPAYIRISGFLEANQDFLHDEAVAVYGYNPNSTQKWMIINDAKLSTDPSLTMAPGQGFYVAAQPAGATINFRPNMMDTSSNDDFVSGRTEDKGTGIGFIKLNVSNEGKDYFTELYFTDKATRGLDRGYDAMVYRSEEEAFSIYSHLVEDNKGTNMGIQSVGFSDLITGVKFPIGIHASEGMQITVNISEFNLPEGTEVRLEDNSNNTFTLLNTSDYTFTATSNLTKTGRFFLHVSTKPLSNKDDILNGLQIYTTNKSKTLYIKGLIKDQAQINIYDIQGRIMTSASLKANTNSNEVDMSSLSTGIYVAELKSSGSVKTQKVILK